MESFWSSVLVAVVTATALSGCFGDSSDHNEPQEDEASGSDNPEIQELRESIYAARGNDTVVVNAQRVQNALTVESPEEFEVVLEPSTILTNSTWGEITGERVDLPSMEAYEGYVDNHSNWPVRLLLTEEWARGYIITLDSVEPDWPALTPIPYIIRINLESNQPKDVNVTTKDTDSPLFSTSEPAGQECYPTPTPISPVTERPANQELIIARIILDGDAWFASSMGRHAFPMMVAMLQEADAILEFEVGIRFQLVGLHVHDNEDVTVMPVASNLYGVEPPQFEEIREYWDNRQDVDRDMVHFFHGVENGGIGMANCVGGVGTPNLAYSFTSFMFDRNFPAMHANVLAHELAHLFNADHHYANHAEVGFPGVPTLMNGSPGPFPVFSSLSKSVIRGWAEEYLEDNGNRM